jgi:uncharacterized membrane protein HdeD (DUF308 family)
LMTTVISKYWWVFTLRGLIAMAFGLVTLLWSTLTLYEMVLLFGFFALFDAGLTIFTCSARGKDKGRWPLLFEGMAGLAVCVIVFVVSNLGSRLWPRLADIMLVYYIAGWAILTGLFKAITAFRLRKEVKEEWVLGLGGVVSILAGLILILHAESGAVAVAWLIGIFAIVLSICLTFLGLKFREMWFNLKK